VVLFGILHGVAARGARFGHEADAVQPGFLGFAHDFDHAAIGHALVGAQLHFGFGGVAGRLLQGGGQFFARDGGLSLKYAMQSFAQQGG
jgi:hypothetical protein